MTVGATVGSIRDLFAKVKAIDAKHGKFDLLICVGDFFGPARDVQVSEENDDISQLLDGKLEGMLLSCTTYSILIRRQAPIECYVMQGERPLPTVVIEKFAKTGGELCKNVFLMSMFMKTISTNSRVDISCILGKSGIITTADGLRIACLGGTFEPNIYGSAEAAPVRVFLVLCALSLDVHNTIGLRITIFLPPHYRTVTVKYTEQIIDLNTKELFLPCFHPSRLNFVATH